jgi:STAM-binding protein
LTDPPGLDIISNCKKTPAFHPHPDLPIYTVSGLDVYIAKKKKKKKSIDVLYM